MKTNIKFRGILVIVALFLAAGGWSAEEKVASATQTKRIGVAEFDQLRTSTNAVVLDVRSAAEVKTGSIPGSIHIDIHSSSFTEKINVLDKNKTYLVHCAAGMRSARACQKMEGMGFKELYDLAPGFDGWKKAQIQNRAKE